MQTGTSTLIRHSRALSSPTADLNATSYEQVLKVVKEEQKKHVEPEDDDRQQYVDILEKSAEERTDEEVQQLYDWVTQLKVQLFQDSPLDVAKELCRIMQYETVPANRTVFRQGDVSNKLYIIVSGAVSLWVKNDKDDAEYPDPGKLPTIIRLQQMAQESSVVTPSIQKMKVTVSPHSAPKRKFNPLHLSHVPKPIDTSNLKEDPVIQQNRIKTNPSSPKGRSNPNRRTLDMKKLRDDHTFVGILRAGGPKTTFGELGLIAEQERSATVRTDVEECEFLTIDKKDFDRVLKAKYAEALHSKVEAMKTFPLFSKMSDNHLKKISLHMYKRTCPPKQLLIKEGAPLKDVYFILKGQVELTKATAAPSDEKHKSLKVGQQSAYQQIRILNPGDMCGEEALQEVFKASCGARCLTECELFQVDKEDLQRRVRGDVVKQVLGDERKQESDEDDDEDEHRDDIAEGVELASDDSDGSAQHSSSRKDRHSADDTKME